MPRPDVSDQRIPQILDAAALVFSQHGIDGASMTQIAEVSGVSKATIYHYFASKDALILALVQRLFESDQPHRAQRFADNDPAVDCLRAYSIDLVALLERNRVLIPIIAEIRARAERTEALQPMMRAYFAGYIRAFTEVIQQGIERGELRESVTASAAALAFVALVEGAILIAQHTGQPLERVMTTSVDTFLAGLRQ